MGTSYTSYSTNADVVNQTVKWPVGSNNNVRVLDIIAGGGNGAIGTVTETTWDTVDIGSADGLQLLFGETFTVDETNTTDFIDGTCRNCDPVAMIFFDDLGEVGSDATSLLASVSNTANVDSVIDYNAIGIHDDEASRNIEFKTGVYVANDATTTVTANIQQDINMNVESGAGAANIIGEVMDNAGFTDGYTAIAGVGGQADIDASTNANRGNDELRTWVRANTPVGTEGDVGAWLADSSNYTDAFLAHLADNPAEISSYIISNAIQAYENDDVTAAGFAKLMPEIAATPEATFQVLLQLGFNSADQTKVVDLLVEMNSQGVDKMPVDMYQFIFDLGTPQAVAGIVYGLGDNEPVMAELANVLNNATDINGVSVEVYVADLIQNTIGLTNLAACQFDGINNMLTKLDSSKFDNTFDTLKTAAEGGDLMMQAYLAEAIIAGARGIINDPNNLLGELQFDTIMFAAGQNWDDGGLDIFGIDNYQINVDTVIIATENLYQSLVRQGETDNANEVLNQLLHGVIDFEFGATLGSPEYYNNIKRIIFISQSDEGSLLNAIGKSPDMRNYLSANEGMMNNEISRSINELVGISGFIGSDADGYYVKHVDLSGYGTGLLDALETEGSDVSYLETYRKMGVLDGRDANDLDLGYQFDVSDWVFSSTDNIYNVSGEPRGAEAPEDSEAPEA